MRGAFDELRIPREVAHRLGYYVYLYIDPRNGRPFYVGKGRSGRALAHLSESAESKKRQTIRELQEAGLEPRIEILAHALPNEETAFRIEAAVIDLLGLDALTNQVRGWKSIQLGRMPLRELVVYYAAKPVEVAVPALLIRINRLFRHSMSPAELYDATRGTWKLGIRRERARYAMAVFEGVVRAVYLIDGWYPAGSTSYETKVQDKIEGRWEFVGRPAPTSVAGKYVDGSVGRYFKKGLQSPVVYVNC